MCGIACYIGSSADEGLKFASRAQPLLRHRGPDDTGIFNDGNVALLHMRLSILELSALGHQPMASSCGRYQIIFNGEIYNHQELRNKYLSSYAFKGHSDTETIIELFRIRKEKMLNDLVGMWAIIIWDKTEKKLFISRDRYGQKPLYTRRLGNNTWLLSSEIKPLFADGEHPDYNPTALAEFIALGNYGHLGAHTFFKDILQFPQGCYAWLSAYDSIIDFKPYWVLPDIRANDKVPFDAEAKRKLHDLIVEAVLSQTLSDVPIGITLSGGIDSSIVTGILSSYYDKQIHIFTAQSPNSAFDETRYVDAVIKKWNNPRFVVHRKNLNALSIKDDLVKYINIQEEPFGDPSIIAHGFLMQMAAEAGIKVILNGQGADEIFFGYNNMAQAILPSQFKSLQFGRFYKNLKAMKLGKNFMMRALLQSTLPDLENKLRIKSRLARRSHILPQLLDKVDDSMVKMYSYENLYNVWSESVYGVHLPHLVQYDDRNGMAYSIEGRMPFLDHRIAEFVATIKPEEFLKNGLRKYILREACRQYMPDEVYNRTDKIGFFTPLADALMRDSEWVLPHFNNIPFIKPEFHKNLVAALNEKRLDTPNALHIWRQLSVSLWMKEFNIL